MSPLLLQVVLVAVLAAAQAWAAVAAGEMEIVGWSSVKDVTGLCAALPSTKQSLVFVFDDFSVAEFSKATGAYCENLEGKCPATTLSMVKKFVMAQPASCQSLRSDVTNSMVDGSDIKAIIAAARSGNGVHVIEMHMKLSDISAMQDAVIFEALEEARGASNGDLAVHFAGKTSGELSSRDSRTLQAVVPLTIRMAPDTFIGLMFLVLGHLLLIFFLCCCMDGISAQTKYAKQYPLRGKELS